MKTYLQINLKDNVAVALTPLSAGTPINFDSFSFNLKEDIPQGHKFALTNIKKDEQINMDTRSVLPKKTSLWAVGSISRISAPDWEIY